MSGLIRVAPRPFIADARSQWCGLSGYDEIDLPVDFPSGDGQRMPRRYRRRSFPQGVEVVVPAGGLPMLLFARERAVHRRWAIVLNGIAVVAKAAEMAVKLRRLTGAVVSRRGIYAKASPEAISEFLDTQ